MTGLRVLVVDDEPEFSRVLRSILSGNGFEPTLVATGEEALAYTALHQPDLVLLDLKLPGIDGLEVCRQLREERRLDIPIIVLSAHGEEESKVKALDLGADDFLTKPFGVRELLARMRAALRRAHGGRPSDQKILTHGAIQMDLEHRLVSVNGKPVHLTPKEYKMLHHLFVNVGKLVTHTALLQAVWGPEYADARAYLHVFIGQLRRKVEPDPAHPRHLQTVPGVGYRLSDHAE